MNNYVQKGDTITLTAPAAGFTSGTPVMVGGMLVVPKKTAASGATAACVFVGVFEIAKTAGEAWTAGQVLKPADSTVNMTDDDSAASNGTQVYVVITDVGGAYLASVTANDASCLVTSEESDDYVAIEDDDNAATAGVALYFDEDGQEDERFQFVSPINADVYLQTANGRRIRIKDNDDAATAGVAVYVDDDGATADERLLFVSPTNADGEGFARGGI